MVSCCLQDLIDVICCGIGCSGVLLSLDEMVFNMISLGRRLDGLDMNSEILIFCGRVWRLLFYRLYRTFHSKGFFSL